MGDWYVWGGFSPTPNRAPFEVNQSRRFASFTDGLSNTLLASEGKTFTHYYRDCGAGLSQINNSGAVPPPAADPYAVAPEYLGGPCSLRLNAGHAVWADGHVHQTGFTTAWTPNRKILGSPSRNLDLDINGLREKLGGPTFAAVTARSWHPGGVNALLGDGSVRFVKDSINGEAWRGLGTIRGGEVISADAY